MLTIRTYAPAAQQPPRLPLFYQLLLADRLLRFGFKQSVERELLLPQKANQVSELQTLVWRIKRLLVASIHVRFVRRTGRGNLAKRRAGWRG